MKPSHKQVLFSVRRGTGTSFAVICLLGALAALFFGVRNRRENNPHTPAPELSATTASITGVNTSDIAIQRFSFHGSDPVPVPSIASAVPTRKIAIPAVEPTPTGVGTVIADTVTEAPLPNAPPVDDSGRQLTDEKTRRRLELIDEASKDPDPHSKQRTLLTVAGYYIGDKNWAAAEALYKDMQESPYPDVRFSAERNLRVVYRLQAISLELDPRRKETLRLELAQFHRELGHEPTARRMWHELAMTAIQPEVRTESTRQLSLNVVPVRPALPKGINSTEETK